MDQNEVTHHSPPSLVDHQNYCKYTIKVGNSSFARGGGEAVIEKTLQKTKQVIMATYTG